MNDRTSGTDHSLLIVHSPLTDSYVLTLRGIADSRASEDLKADFARATDSRLPLVVNLAALQFGDEALLGLLLNAHQAGGVTLVGPICDSFQRRLDTAGVTTWFTICPTLNDALDRSGNRPSSSATT
ncbi:STAS domain-containing protein [Streptomyces sp. NPDC048330]|uniref:STAS domain-containing protein n=1 Tax=Streptomyces sp. NPDC048330 TaxID=3365533 RepID=UPI003721B4B7